MASYLGRFGFDEWIERVKAAKTHGEHEKLGREMATKIEAAYPNESSRKKPLSAVRKAALSALEGVDCPQYLAFAGRGNEVFEHPYAMNFLFVGEPETERDRYWEKLEEQGLADKAKAMLSDTVNDDSDPETIVSESISVETVEPKPEAEPETEDADDGDLDNLIRTAMDIRGLSRNELIDTAIRYYCKNVISNAEVHNIDLSKLSSKELIEDKQYSRIKGRGEELAKRAIEAITAYNNQQKSPDTRWYVSSRAVADVGHVGLRAANVVLNELGGHKEINKQWGLSPYHRRGDERQITEDVSLIEENKQNEETDNAA